METQILCANYDADNTYFDDKQSKDIFKSNVYAHQDVKSALVRIQNHKCCFCESKVTHISDGDVEHFRPKAEWSKENDNGTKTKKKPGYYFLAYEWNNLMLSCQMCNQRIKGNNFPLVNETARANVTHNYNVEAELPVFINPTLEDPELHITFYEETPQGITYRGRKTIEYLQLDRLALNEVRKEKLKDLFTLRNVVNSIVDIDSREKAVDILLRRLHEIIEKNDQYVNMVKANFSDFL
ncbi:hypothetical protein H8S90_19680 [Olivibacter sp. SDN3]|uniref:hypothetical protein n=1 Tax=Olivibacter sp. SDN3 TaxID=2764720 RepID=UPI0016512647|nr:hypothetical protein [Olivibacter sp. SDN3]QNL48954.1 hypothetical protein H8S90_19680 [Olivibacter sp. SDN3]